MMSIETCEDCLEILVGLQEGPKFNLVASDISFLSSIARQTFKGVGFTDRQYEAVKEKLQMYVPQFTDYGYTTTRMFDSLRLPLRKLDRAKWIKVLNDESGPTIGVRFVFNQKLIFDVPRPQKQ